MMAYQDHVTRALEELTNGLIPFVESEMRAVYQQAWWSQVKANFRDDRHSPQTPDEPIHWDAQSLLTVMWDQWNAVFRRKLSLMERSLVGELREFRNRWAHRGDFDFEDTYRTIDSIARLLKAVGAQQSQFLALQKQELLQQQFGEQVNAELQQKAEQRSKWQTMVVNGVCAILIISQLFYQYDWRNVWSIAVLFSFGFGYLTYRQLSRERPAVGLRECPRCRKIIYSVRCPYCEPNPVASAPGTTTPAAA